MWVHETFPSVLLSFYSSLLWLTQLNSGLTAIATTSTHTEMEYKKLLLLPIWRKADAMHRFLKMELMDHRFTDQADKQRSAFCSEESKQRNILFYFFEAVK